MKYLYNLKLHAILFKSVKSVAILKELGLKCSFLYFFILIKIGLGNENPRWPPFFPKKQMVFRKLKSCAFGSGPNLQTKEFI